MKSLKLFLSLILAFGFSIILKGQQTVTIRVDPGQARGGTTSEVFESIRFIPLETNKESLFGTIHQLEVFDSLYFILDKSSRAIFIFTANGRFKTKIKAGGSDKFFDYFTINKTDKQILVLNNFADKVLVFDFEGNLIKTMPYPERPGSIFYFSNNNYLYFVRRKIAYTDTFSIKYDLLFADSSGHIKNRLHPYNTQNENGEYNIENNFINYSGVNGYAMFSMPFEYSIMQLNDTGLYKRYNFIFPAVNSLPRNFLNDSSFKGKRAKLVYGNPDSKQKVYYTQTSYRLGNYLLFSAPMGRSDIGDNINYLYNLDKGTLLSFSRVTGDASSAYFPVMSSVFEKILYADNGIVYSSIPAFRLFSIKDALSKTITYPTSIASLMTTGSKDNNTVLVLVTLKKNL